MRIECRDDDGNEWLIVRLWKEPNECGMCGALGDLRHAVPWCCGPVLEGDSDGGYETVCEPCHDRWAAWSDSMQYQGA